MVGVQNFILRCCWPLEMLFTLKRVYFKKRFFKRYKRVEVIEL